MSRGRSSTAPAIDAEGLERGHRERDRCKPHPTYGSKSAFRRDQLDARHIGLDGHDARDRTRAIHDLSSFTGFGSTQVLRQLALELRNSGATHNETHSGPMRPCTQKSLGTQTAMLMVSSPPMTRPRFARHSFVVVVGGILAFTLPGCGGDSGGGGGACPGGGTGGACNTVTNIGQSVTPNCESGPIPTGTGGVIEDGTYALTGETYYGGNCSPIPISGTFVIAQGCWQGSFGSPVLSQGVTLSAAVAPAGSNKVSISLECSSASGTADAPLQTFTVNGDTLTLYTNNAAVGNPNPDRAEVLVRQ